MKKTFYMLFILLVFIPIFSGCTEEFVDICVFSPPDKIIYEVGENLVLDGLTVRAIKTDSATVKVSISHDNISGFDSTAPGKKDIVVEYGDFSTSFTVFVAHSVITTASNLQAEITNSNDNDVIKLSAGTYEGENYKNIQITKPLTIIGESKKDVNFHGNFLVGQSTATEKVSFQNINFLLNNEIENGIINFEGSYTADKNLAAIHSFSSKEITVNNCNFKGYPFGVLATDADGLMVTNCMFDSLFLGGVKTLNSSKNVMISKNNFINIATNTLLANEENKQEYLATVALAFNKTEVAGIIIYNNAITKVALKTGEWVKFNDVDALLNSNEILSQYNYVNNTASILLFSTNGEDLPVFGVAVAKNSFGNALNNLLYGLGRKQNVDASAVLFNY